MKPFKWNHRKNQWLMGARDVSFEEIVYYIQNGGLLDSLEHPNRESYPGQKLFEVKTHSYCYLVPYVEEEEFYFLQTVIPDRKVKRKHEKKSKT